MSAERVSTKLLRDAADVIDQRAKLRDTPAGERSMSRAVAAFNGLIGGDRRLTELEGWLFMCCLKMSRATAGVFHLDDFTDLAGYAALAGECGEAEQEATDVESLEWNPNVDEPMAMLEGWCVFHVDRSRCKYEIEKLDDPEEMGIVASNKFLSDDAALGYVWERALQGSPLHRRAIMAVWNSRP